LKIKQEEEKKKIDFNNSNEVNNSKILEEIEKFKNKNNENLFKTEIVIDLKFEKENNFISFKYDIDSTKKYKDFKINLPKNEIQKYTLVSIDDIYEVKENNVFDALAKIFFCNFYF
jgi:hypothetical protein